MIRDIDLDALLQARFANGIPADRPTERADIGERPLPDFDAGAYHGQALICVTYDDGLANNFTRAAPLHLAHAIPANFAVIASKLVDPNGSGTFMCAQMCRLLFDLGFEISSHGMHHKRRLQNMTLEQLHEDVHGSRAVIERVLGISGAVDTYCIPYSNARQLHIDYLHSAYDLVRRGGGCMNAMPLRYGESVSSYPVKRHMSFADIRTLIDAAIDGRDALVLMMHGVAAVGAPLDDYQIAEDLLEQVLDYISRAGEARILPVRLSSLHQIGRAAAG